MVNSETVCKHLSKSGATFEPFKRNPVKGLRFVMSRPRRMDGIKIFSDLDPEMSISKKHNQAVLSINDDYRDIRGTQSVSLADYFGVTWYLNNDQAPKQLKHVIQQYRSTDNPSSGQLVIKRMFSIPQMNVEVNITKKTANIIRQKRKEILALEDNKYSNDDYQKKAKFILKDKIEFEYEVSAPPNVVNALVGIDETSHFICMLPKKADNVEHAHEILRPQEVPEGSLRQGEFFFIPASKEDLLSVFDNPVTHRPYRTLRGWELEEGSSHRAEEIIHSGKDNELEDLTMTLVKGRIFDIRRGRHKHLQLDTWHKVIRNTELKEEDLPDHMQSRARYYD